MIEIVSQSTTASPCTFGGLVDYTTFFTGQAYAIDSIATNLPLSPRNEAISFAISRGLDGNVRKAIEIATKHFQNTGMVRLRRRSDPEIDDEWLEVGIYVLGTSEEVLDAFDQFTTEWCRAVSPETNSAVRLIYLF